MTDLRAAHRASGNSTTASGVKVGLYARISTADPPILPMQLAAMGTYTKCRGWKVGIKGKENDCGVKTRLRREALHRAARQGEIDGTVFWRLDRSRRSVLDLVRTPQELRAVGVGFVPLIDALDMTTLGGRAPAGVRAEFAEFARDIQRDRVKAGIAQACKEGRSQGWPPTVHQHADAVRTQSARDVSKCQIAADPDISRPSVRRMPVAIRARQPQTRRSRVSCATRTAS